MTAALQTFEPNTNGRDFVIGDLHGCFSVLENLLQNLQFDEAVDRMFSVGDLVDRGPDSLKCLQLIKKPWFHAVRANHEQIMAQTFEFPQASMFWFQAGGFWGAAALQDFQERTARAISDETAQLVDLVKATQELPFMITVKLDDGKKFHIIHAELPIQLQGLSDTDLEDPELVRQLSGMKNNRDDVCLLWSRELFINFAADLSDHAKLVRTAAYHVSWKQFNDKLSHIISGHTPVQKPFTLFGQTNIDTKAYGSYFQDAKDWNALTCVELKTWKFYQATEKEFREVQPVQINSADIDNLKAPNEIITRS